MVPNYFIIKTLVTMYVHVIQVVSLFVQVLAETGILRAHIMTCTWEELKYENENETNIRFEALHENETTQK